MFLQFAILILLSLVSVLFSFSIARACQDELRPGRRPAVLVGAVSFLSASAVLLYGALPLWLQVATLVVLLFLLFRVSLLVLYALFVLPLLLLMALSPASQALVAAALLLPGLLSLGVVAAQPKGKL